MKRPPGVVLLIPSAREFDRGLRRGIVEYAQAHGPWTFYEEPPGYLQGLAPRQRLRSMRAWNADGIILLQDRLAEVKPLGIPMVVSIGTRKLGPAYSQVVCANESAGTRRKATATRQPVRMTTTLQEQDQFSAPRATKG